MTLEGSTHLTNTCTPDDLGRTTHVTQSGPSGIETKNVDFNYRLDNSFESIFCYYGLAGPEVVIEDYKYYTDGRLREIEHKSLAQTLRTLQYSYDLKGRLGEFDSFNHYAYQTDDLTIPYDEVDQVQQSFFGYDRNGNRQGDGFATEAGNCRTFRWAATAQEPFRLRLRRGSRETVPWLRPSRRASCIFILPVRRIGAMISRSCRVR